MKKVMVKNTEFRRGEKSDLTEIRMLLKENSLPFDDLEISEVDFLVAVNDGKIIGCIGIEKKDHDGLLRSFAVSSNYRDQGIGSILYERLIEKSRSDGIRVMHLLTTTAERYFGEKGFVITKREFAPVKIRQTVEFSGICPLSSVYMTLRL